MGRFASHILTVSFHPSPNAECKSCCLSPADVVKLNLGHRLQLKLKACFRIRSFLFLKLHSHICGHQSRSAKRAPPPSLLSLIPSSILRRCGGKKPSGSATVSSLNVFVSYFWPTRCNGSCASAHKMLIRA